MEAGYQADCSNSHNGCRNTFRIPHEGKFLGGKWWCESCSEIIEHRFKDGVSVAKQLYLVGIEERVDG